MVSIVDRSVWDQLDLSVRGIACHMAAGIWDRVTQGTGVLVEEGLVGERLWGSRKCNEQLKESPQQPWGYPGNRENMRQTVHDHMNSGLHLHALS